MRGGGIRDLNKLRASSSSASSNSSSSSSLLPQKNERLEASERERKPTVGVNNPIPSLVVLCCCCRSEVR